jgi:hypothetical protein
MTEAKPRYETVTVEFEELKANIHRYYELKKTKRLVVMKDGEMYTAVGRWIADEQRTFLTHWPDLLLEMFPDPVYPGDGELGQRAFEETRGSRPISSWTPQP